MRLKSIDNWDWSFQNKLAIAEEKAEKIRAELGLNLPITPEQFFQAVDAKLAELHFQIIYTNKLHCIKDYGHLPSMTVFNHQTERKEGGTIYIYDKYSDKHQRELLLHELVHIMDTISPTYSTNFRDLQNGFLLRKEILEDVELETELTSFALLMPYSQIQTELFDSSHDIESVVNKYSCFETDRVVKWIALHDFFACHYASVFIRREDGKFVVLDEFSRFNEDFKIADVLDNPESIASQSKSAEEFKQGESTINNKTYYCFSFYEKDIQQPLPSYDSPKGKQYSYIVPVERILTGNKLTIIGWPNSTHETIKKLRFNPS